MQAPSRPAWSQDGPQLVNVVTAQLDELMASSQDEAIRRGRVLQMIPVPAVWVARMYALSSGESGKRAAGG